MAIPAGQKLAAKLLPILLPLFPDIVLNLDGEQVEATVDGSTIWTGRVTGAPVSAVDEAAWDRALKVYENPGAMPHAFLVHRALVIADDDAQAEEKPHEDPLMPKWATRLKFSVPEIDAMIPSGEHFITPCWCMRCSMWPIRKGEPPEAAYRPVWGGRPASMA